MKKCELCGHQARMFCESDQANLCWDCDEKVHCANFLVAKHSRSLLCHVCQSPTPWAASGRKLTPTVSVCEGCVEVHDGKCEQDRRRDNEVEVDDGDDFVDAEGFDSYEGGDSQEDDDGEDDDDEEEDDEDGENQVVPWSYASSSSPPPPPTVTSSSEGEISAGAGVASKRMREYGVDLDSDVCIFLGFFFLSIAFSSVLSFSLVCVEGIRWGFRNFFFIHSLFWNRCFD